MSKTARPSKPRAYRFDDPDVTLSEADEARFHDDDGIHIEREPEEIIDAADGTAVPMGRKRRVPWLGILFSSVFTLVLFALGIAAESLIRDLFAVAPWLGWLAFILFLAALIALFAVIGRELSGLWRERKIEHIREGALAAIAQNDSPAALKISDEMVSLYAGRPETARGRAEIADVRDAILDAEDRLIIVERALLAERDVQAKRVVAQAAKQVSLVTAVSPRAIIDVAFVLFSAARVLRRVSAIYGGRPGTLGFLRLARAAISHLTVTGGVAMGDDLVQQVLGLGLAARVSAKLGEGVLNGLMTARFGVAAIAVCRPLPYIGEVPPKFSDVAGELLASKTIGEDMPEKR
jgi:putative membrane protein